MTDKKITDGRPPATVQAMEDARRAGVGFVQVLRVTTEQYRVTRLDPAMVLILNEAPHAEVLAEAVLALPCSYCHVPAGRRCRTTSGRLAPAAHIARTAPVVAVWRAAFRDGVVEAVRRLVSDWETPADELLKAHQW